MSDSPFTIRTATADFADKDKRTRITQAIEDAIRRSFILYPMRNPTKAEVKRRFNLCFEAYRVMRNDMGWSTARTIDHFDRVLESALTGKELVMSDRSSWFGAA